MTEMDAFVPAELSWHMGKFFSFLIKDTFR